MSHKKLLIVGAGGHGRSVADCAVASGQWQDIHFADDQFGRSNQVNGFPVVGKFRDFLQLGLSYDGVVIAIGNNKVRASLIDEALQQGLPLVSIIHPQAIVSSFAEIAAGSTIMAGSVVGANAQIGLGCIVNCLSCVDHDVTLGNYAHLGVGVKLAGGVSVGTGANLQAGSVAGYQVAVADWASTMPGEALMVNQRLYAAGKSHTAAKTS